MEIKYNSDNPDNVILFCLGLQFIYNCHWSYWPCKCFTHFQLIALL